MTHDQIEVYILSLPKVERGAPFGDEVAVYTVNDEMFALLQLHKNPVNVSLRCDPQLATVLRENYETVMPGQKLDRRHWNTIILSGQLPWEEIKGLIDHAYYLVAGGPVIEQTE